MTILFMAYVCTAPSDSPCPVSEGYFNVPILILTVSLPNTDAIFWLVSVHEEMVTSILVSTSGADFSADELR